MYRYLKYIVQTKDSKIYQNKNRNFLKQTRFYLVHSISIKYPLVVLINVHIDERHNHNILYHIMERIKVSSYDDSKYNEIIFS